MAKNINHFLSKLWTPFSQPPKNKSEQGDLIFTPDALPRELNLYEIYNGSPVPKGETRIVANVGDNITLADKTMGLVTFVDPTTFIPTWIRVTKNSEILDSEYHPKQRMRKMKRVNKPEPRKIVIKTTKSRRNSVHEVCKTGEQSKFVVFPD